MPGWSGLGLGLLPFMASVIFFINFSRRLRGAEGALGRAVLLAAIPFSIGQLCLAQASLGGGSREFIAAHHLIAAAFLLPAAGAASDLLRAVDRQRADSDRLLMRRVLDVLPPQVIVLDDNGRCLLCNRPATETLPPDLGPAPAGLQHVPAWAANLANQDDSLVAVADSRGSLRTLKIRARQIESPADGCRLRVLTATDVTEFQRVQSALEERLRFSRTLMDTIPLPVFCKDAAGLYSDCNHAFEKFFGKSRAEVVGLGIGQVFPAANVPFLRSADCDLLERGGYQEYETRIARADGDLRTIRSHKMAFADASGRPAGLVGVIYDLTDQLAVERALRESEQRLRACLDSAPDGIFVADASGHYLDANPAGCAMLGRTREALLGLDLREIVAPESREDVAAHFARVRQEGSATGEIVVLRGDGTTVWIRIDAVKLDDGRCLAFCKDISARKRAELELAAREAQLREVLRNQGEGVVLLDADLRFTLANPAGESALGAAAGELIGRPLVDFLPSDARRRLEEDVWPNLAHGHTCFDLEVVRPDRSRRQLLVTAARQPAPDGAPGGILATFRDITERKAAEEALRASEERMRLILDQAHDAFISVDTAGVIRNWNIQAEQLFGWRRGEAVGRLLTETLRPEIDFAAPAAATTAAGECLSLGGQGLALETVVHARDGREIPVALTVWRVQVSGSELYNAFIRDQSEMLRERLERAHVEVQLRHAQKLEAIGQLASGIAHEINTPTQFVGDNVRFLGDAFGDLLMALRDHGALLEAASRLPATAEAAAGIAARLERIDLAYLTEEVPTAIRQSLEGIERVTSIVRAMKELAHPGDPDAMTATDLNRAVCNTITVSRNEWKYVSQLETELAPDLPPVPCLAGEINQVLLNLLINAAHAVAERFGGDGSRKGLIRVQTRHGDGWAEIAVSDNGAGIPAAVRSRIFEPFFTTKPVGKGSGQGLTIAHAVVVNKHRGSLTFESQEGRGTTFVVRLPLAPSNRTESQELEHEAHLVR
jgi:PAS domain S-box-containing protein